MAGCCQTSFRQRPKAWGGLNTPLARPRNPWFTSLMQFKVNNLGCLHEWDQEKVKFALKGLHRITALQEHDDLWLSANLTETNDLTSLQVLNRLKGGDQLSIGDELNTLDFNLVLYRKSFSKVVGYTFTDSLTIWVNRKFFGGPKGIASNLFHEATHQLGFLHNANWATTVPYTANRIVEALWDKHCKDIDAEYLAWWNS